MTTKKYEIYIHLKGEGESVMDILNLLGGELAVFPPKSTFAGMCDTINSGIPLCQVNPRKDLLTRITRLNIMSDEILDEPK